MNIRAIKVIIYYKCKFVTDRVQLLFSNSPLRRKIEDVVNRYDGQIQDRNAIIRDIKKCILRYHTSPEEFFLYGFHLNIANEYRLAFFLLLLAFQAQVHAFWHTP